MPSVDCCQPGDEVVLVFSSFGLRAKVKVRVLGAAGMVTSDEALGYGGAYQGDEVEVEFLENAEMPEGFMLKGSRIRLWREYGRAVFSRWELRKFDWVFKRN